MPFIGRDWRSPGEAWVKTESLGWQRAKIIESTSSHPSACHMRSCNEYLDTSSCISPRSWPPKTECGKHMPKEKNHQKSKSSQRKLSHSWLEVVNSNQTNPIDNNTIGIVTDDVNACCCSKNLNCSFMNNKMISKSVSPERRSSSIDTNYNNEERERSSTPSCPRSDSANSSSSLFENYNSEQELLTSTPTVHHRTLSPNPSCTQRLSPTKSNDSSSGLQEPQHQQTKSQTILVKINNEEPVISSLLNNTNDLSPSLNESQSLNYTEDDRQSSMSASSSYLSHKLNNLNNNNNNDGVNNSENNQLTAQSAHSGGFTCCHHHNPRPLSPTNSVNTTHHITVKHAPHCQITLKPTREVATYNTISEAFYRLDFCNAIHDIRRFNYICKLLHLLITQNLTSLSGCATRILFTMLEQVAWQVASNKQNIHILYNLLDDLKKMIQKYYCWGRPIGSSLLWQQHFSTIERISHLADQIDIAPPPSDNNNPQKTINDLPAEMIHEIMLRLNDYRDLVHSAEASSVMQSILNGQHIWRQLCKYHFSKQQLRLAIENHYGLSPKIPSWSSEVKFARFVSADGRSICRKPVNQFNRNKHTKTSSSSLAKPILNKKKSVLETNTNHISRHKDTNQNKEVSYDISGLNSASSKTTYGCSASLLGNTIPTTSKNSQNLEKIDEIERPITSPSSIDSSTRVDHSKENFGSDKGLQSKLVSHEYPTKFLPSTGKQDSSINSVQTRLKDKTNLVNSSTNTTCNNNNSCNYRPQEELDWEQVFHQLRKKFGLKEEYADCLLLCRYCRCLFWKSFGHPCIKAELINERKSNDASSSVGNHRNNQSIHQQANENVDDQPRASVAVLSQSYLQNANNQYSSNYHRNIRNMDGLRRQVDNTSGSISGQPSRNGSLSNDSNIGGSSPMSRSMLQRARSNLVQQPQSLIGSDNNLNRSNNNDNYNRSSRNGPVDRNSQQQSQSQQQQQQQQQQQRNNNPANQQRKNPYTTIPSHVAISPQAFLKFFSL